MRTDHTRRALHLHPATIHDASRAAVLAKHLKGSSRQSSRGSRRFGSGRRSQADRARRMASGIPSTERDALKIYKSACVWVVWVGCAGSRFCMLACAWRRVRANG